MEFIALHILETMLEFYDSTPINKRFDKYLYLLQGNSKDMILPIAGYNPMGNELVTDKIRELLELDAERILIEKIDEFNINSVEIERQIKVGINVCDDIGSSWSQIYNTDYNSKFQQASLVKRNFCAPLFYLSQSNSPSSIGLKIEEYFYRTLYNLLYGQVFTLKDHVKQELFVTENCSSYSTIIKPATTLFDIDKFYKEYAHETDHSIIFNFFYGDSASKSVGYKCHGVHGINGFEYIRQLVK